MTVSIAYLGPEGTYTQLAALAYSAELEQKTGQPVVLSAYPSISQAMWSTATGTTALTIVPVENLIEGGVTATLDTLWKLQQLKIQHALVMPIRHGFLSQAKRLEQVRTVYSHPQALAQCQQWLEKHLPNVEVVPTSSTTEAVQHLSDNPATATIASEWAAQLYELPILAHNINDYSDNRTKFWVLGKETSPQGTYTSLAFSLPINAPGALLKPLQVFASHSINLSRIESRPTKRSLGEYLFFVDLEAGTGETACQQALQELASCTETVVNFGSYNLLSINDSLAAAQGRYRTES